MPNPKRRHSNTRTRLRRAHDSLKGQIANACPQCGAARIPHCVCSSCGFYRGRQVIAIRVKEAKKK